MQTARKRKPEIPPICRATMAMGMPRLYLIAPPVSDGASYAPLFADATAMGAVACVLLQPAAQDAGGNERIVRALAPVLQKQGIACLVAGDPRLAIRGGADGAHIEGEDNLRAAADILKPGLIAGAGGLKSRHAAMTAGEAGADYVMFGAEGEPLADTVERLAWWAEIFVVPCVGYADDLDSIGDLVRAGADFVALGGAVFADPRGADVALRQAAALLAPTGLAPTAEVAR